MGHDKDLEARDSRIKGLTGQLHGHLVTSAATSALAAAGSIDTDLAMPHLARQVQVQEEDGKFNVHVVDAQGDTRYSGSTGAPMTITELVAEMKGTDKFKPLFKSEAPKGGGKQPGHTHVPAGGGGEMSATDKIEAGLAARRR
jgi:hypothetical protein